MKRNLQKPLIVAGIVTAVGAGSLVGGSAVVSATTQSGNGPMAGLASAIAKKFNLAETDVQNVIDEQRTTMEANREQAVKDQVATLVSDGKLTQDQADKINAKRAELEKQRESDRANDQSLTDDERQTKREENRTAIDTWLKDNGIDSQYAYLLGKGMHGRGGGFGHMNRMSE